MAGVSSDQVITGVADVATHDNGAPGGIRTPDLLIRSQLLYPLSYGREFHAQTRADNRRVA